MIEIELHHSAFAIDLGIANASKYEYGGRGHKHSVHRVGAQLVCFKCKRMDDYVGGRF